MKKNASSLWIGVLMAAICAVGVLAASGKTVSAEEANSSPKTEFSDESFLDAAYDNCATVENRSAESCDCERKLIGDRVNTDDKKMAFLYWTDKKTFTEKFEAKRKADPTWQRGFSERFSALQAIIIAACGA